MSDLLGRYLSFLRGSWTASVAALLVGGAAIVLPAVATTEAGPLVVTVATSPNPYALKASSSVADSVGILGYETGPKAVALEGYVTQPDSAGLEGFAQATSGTISDGVFGDSANGFGVFGVGAGAGAAGVYGSNASAGGVGVLGSGASTGVEGKSAIEGVLGITQSTSSTIGTGYGVFADDQSPNDNQVGVAARSPYQPIVANLVDPGTTTFSVDDVMIGIFSDDVTSAGAAAIFGNSNAGIGVGGRTSSNAGYGVLAQDEATTGGSALYSTSAATGSFATDSVASNVMSVALEGEAQAAGSTALIMKTDAASDLEFQAVAGSNLVATLSSTGDLVLEGTSTSTGGAPLSTVRDATGARRVAYGSSQTQPTLEDAGEATLSGGRAYVALDPAFASVLADANYLVFITPRGPSNVYVAQRDLRGFEVRSFGGSTTVAFDYRIVGRPRAERAQPRLALFHDLGRPSLPQVNRAASAPARFGRFATRTFPLRFPQTRDAATPLVVRPNTVR